MKTALIAAIVVLASATLAYLQFSAATQLRQDLAHSETLRAELQAKVADNAQRQASLQEQVNTLEESLSSSAAQLKRLSESLQEAKAILQGDTDTAAAQ